MPELSLHVDYVQALKPWFCDMAMFLDTILIEAMFEDKNVAKKQTWAIFRRIQETHRTRHNMEHEICLESYSDETLFGYAIHSLAHLSSW